MLAELKIGPPGSVADNTYSPLRATRTGEQAVSQAHPRYYEAVARGNVYTASHTAAVTLGASLTATGVTYHLYNPFGSGVNLCILKTTVVLIVCGTAGSVVYAVNNSPIAVTPTASNPLTVTNCLLGSSKTGAGLVYRTMTLPATPTAARIVTGAVATIAGVTSAIIDDVNGELVVAPGCILSVVGLVYVGTSGMMCGMSWEEVPVT